MGGWKCHVREERDKKSTVLLNKIKNGIEHTHILTRMREYLMKLKSSKFKPDRKK